MKALYPAYPFDWSLKTKVRYISDKSFSWCTSLKTIEESSGVMLYAKTYGESNTAFDQQVTVKTLNVRDHYALFLGNLYEYSAMWLY